MAHGRAGVDASKWKLSLPVWATVSRYSNPRSSALLVHHRAAATWLVIPCWSMAIPAIARFLHRAGVVITKPDSWSAASAVLLASCDLFRLVRHHLIDTRPGCLASLLGIGQATVTHLRGGGLSGFTDTPP